MSSWFRVQIPRLIQFPVTWVASVEAVRWVVQILLTFEEIESHGHAQMQASSISVWGMLFFSANSHFRVISLAFLSHPHTHQCGKPSFPSMGWVGWGGGAVYKPIHHFQSHIFSQFSGTAHGSGSWGADLIHQKWRSSPQISKVSEFLTWPNWPWEKKTPCLRLEREKSALSGFLILPDTLASVGWY